MRKVSKGDEIIVKDKNFQRFTFGKSYKVNESTSMHFTLIDNAGDEIVWKQKHFDMYFEFPKSESIDEAPKHYDNSNGSLYLFADKQGLNSYEFEVVKRIVRCRKKKEFISDIKKTIFVLELYLKEQGENYKGEEEILN